MIISRILIGLVFLVNIQCAGAFMLDPAACMRGFGLDAIVGEQMVLALGLLFVIWNVPYVFALADPVKPVIPDEEKFLVNIGRNLEDRKPFIIT